MQPTQRPFKLSDPIEKLRKEATKNGSNGLCKIKINGVIKGLHFAIKQTGDANEHNHQVNKTAAYAEIWWTMRRAQVDEGLGPSRVKGR